MGIIGTTVAQALVTTWSGNTLLCWNMMSKIAYPLYAIFSKAKFLCGDPKTDSL